MLNFRSLGYLVEITVKLGLPIQLFHSCLFLQITLRDQISQCPAVLLSVRFTVYNLQIFLRHRFTAFSSLSICCIHRTVGIDFKI